MRQSGIGDRPPGQLESLRGLDGRQIMLQPHVAARRGGQREPPQTTARQLSQAACRDRRLLQRKFHQLIHVLKMCQPRIGDFGLVQI